MTNQEAVSVAGVKKAEVETIKKAEMAIKQTADNACSLTKKGINPLTVYRCLVSKR